MLQHWGDRLRGQAVHVMSSGADECCREKTAGPGAKLQGRFRAKQRLEGAWQRVCRRTGSDLHQ
jgi:hypothetical protein